MRAVAIDDIEEMHEVLANLLKLIDAEVDLVGTATTVAEGVAKVDELKPNILFLDIDLPDGDGFDVLSQVSYRDFLTIFITGRNDYAIRAFEFQALDYLEKPLDSRRLEQALNWAKQRLEMSSAAERMADMEAASASFRGGELPSRLKVANSEGVHFLPVAKIMYLETADNLITVVMEDGKRVHRTGRLKRFVELLHGYGHFMQVHQSVIVNLHRVSMLKANHMLVLDNGEEVRISARMSKPVKDRLERL